VTLPCCCGHCQRVRLWKKAHENFYVSLLNKPALLPPYIHTRLHSRDFRTPSLSLPGMFGVAARNRALLQLTTASSSSPAAASQLTRPLAGCRGSFVRPVKGVGLLFLFVSIWVTSFPSLHVLLDLSAFLSLFIPTPPFDLAAFKSADTQESLDGGDHGSATEQEAEQSACW